MDANLYQTLSQRTRQPNSGLEKFQAIFGLSSEVGEVAGILKKHLFQGHDLDRDELELELGDVAWYLALTCSVFDLKLGTVLERNVEKLKQRYGEKFTAEESLRRVDVLRHEIRLSSGDAR